MSWLPVACVLMPFATAIATFSAPRSAAIRGGISIAGAASLLLLALAQLFALPGGGTLVARMGGWAPPFGIVFAVDTLGALLVLVTATVGLAVVGYARCDVDEARIAGGFDGFVHVLLAGVVGAFVTGDVFNLYVWFEVMLIASFALMTLGGTARQLDGAVKYVALNLVSTVILLTAIGLLYGLTGTLNFADLHGVLQARPDDGLAGVVVGFFLVAFGIKAAMFPLFFWLPASYHTLPVTVSTLFAALMTKVGVYALLRLQSLMFGPEFELLQPVLLGLAFATMLAGLAGAIAETDLRRLLAWQVVVSIGFMLLGVALGTEAAIAAAVFYLVHAMLAKAVLFLVAGVAAGPGTAGPAPLAAMGGLWRTRPWLALAFLAAALSLIGLPPSSGFWAKLALVEASVDAGAWTTLAVVLGASLLAFLPLIGVWNAVFWKAAPDARPALEPRPGSEAAADGRPGPAMALAPAPVSRAASLLPIAGLTAVAVTIGLFPQPLLELSSRAAASLVDPSGYVRAVLGDAPSTAAALDTDTDR